jgi:hypothetical protein
MAEPVVAQVHYQLQPVVAFTGSNWAMFHAAFTNYARQQGFFAMLGREGDEEPNENAERWRQRMAQATTALTSGWVNEEVLSIFRYSNTDNANTIWRRMNLYYGNITDIRQMRLRDVAERHRQAADESLISWMGSLNIKVSDLEASGIQYR